MKNYKRKYSFETDVPVPDFEEIVKIALDFSESKEKSGKSEPAGKKSMPKKSVPKFDKKMSSMRNQMMKLAEVVAEDESSVQTQVEDTSVQDGSEGNGAEGNAEDKNVVEEKTAVDGGKSDNAKTKSDSDDSKKKK
ncbi:MAG: hypothetical protein JW780_00670 [Clostridiales bacterium]|nr:hypothetical protein [Clostridiales bacterium]